MSKTQPGSTTASPSVRADLPQFVQRIPQRLSLYTGGVGGLILLLLILLALFPNMVAPYDPGESVGRPLERPSPQHVLGTNDIGQDLLSELIWGTRASLSVGLIVGAVAVAVGTVIGLIGGYASGWLAALMMRLADLALALPFLPLIILLSAYLGPSQSNVILVLALVSWAGPSRLIRARVLALLNEPYIEAAYALGCSRLRILARHIWPGVRLIALVQLLLVSSASILAEASLSFLGLGDPSSKSWGTMLYFARSSGAFLGDSWRWWVLPAGLMITITVLSMMLIGFTAEDVLEPQLRG